MLSQHLARSFTKSSNRYYNLSSLFYYHSLLLASSFTTSTTTTTAFAMMSSKSNNNIYDQLQAIIGTDAGGRGMKSLICEGDLEKAARHVVGLAAAGDGNNNSKQQQPPHVVILSGFPCCISETPPTETDGPPGTLAIARASASLQYKTTVVTEDVNQAVFEAAAAAAEGCCDSNIINLKFFPAAFTPEDHEKLQQLADTCDLLISCERSGQSADGNYYTMRGIDMNSKERPLVGPLNDLVELTSPQTKLISIGDGGNELGMGKVIEKIKKNIKDGSKIGCVIPANYLIAASVSNWGGYALAAAIAVAQSEKQTSGSGDDLTTLLEQCLPTEAEEIQLLKRCVKAGCRDGVSGKMDATVDGMPLATSMQCLNDIRQAVIEYGNGNDGK